jgi:hypothetical protein
MSLIGTWDAAPSWGLVGRREVATPLWRLPRDATVRVEAGRAGIELRCEAGTLLVTRAGDPEDHVLETGDRIRVSRRDRAVIWALSDATASAVPLAA